MAIKDGQQVTVILPSDLKACLQLCLVVQEKDTRISTFLRTLVEQYVAENWPRSIAQLRSGK